MLLDLSTKGRGHLVFQPPETTATSPARLAWRLPGQDAAQAEILDAPQRAISLGPTGQPTADALAECWEHGLSVALLRGARVAWLATSQGPRPAELTLRRRQHRQYHDEHWRQMLARSLVTAKIAAQSRVLGQWLRRHPGLGHLLPRIRSLDADCLTLGGKHDMDQIRGLEGHAARTYIEGLGIILGAPFARQPRTAPDPINLLLDTGYSRLVQALVCRLLALGADLATGALHADDDHRPTLALDLMEPLRPLIVDRFVLRWHHHAPGPWHQQDPCNPERCTFTADGRKRFKDQWSTWLHGGPRRPGQMHAVVATIQTWQATLNHVPGHPRWPTTTASPW